MAAADMADGQSALAVAYPRGWLERADGESATDLDLTVLLVNSLDQLEDPPDRLTDLGWWRAVLTDEGHGELAGSLSARDLPALRALRDRLRAVFEASSAEAAAAALNPLLVEADAILQLVVDGPRAQLRVAPGADGLAALRARLPAALAAAVAERGVSRLGTCASDPCRCAFVDHTRGGTRRYCCTACNDRAAARVYRARKRQTSSAPVTGPRG